MVKAMKGSVYLIQCGKTQYYKIGHSTAIEVRLSALQIGCPFELSLIAILSAPQYVEARLHFLFRRSRHRGEWYKFDANRLKRVLFYLTDEGVRELDRSWDKKYKKSNCQRCGCPPNVLPIRIYDDEFICGVCRKCLRKTINKKTVGQVNYRLRTYMAHPEVPVPIWFVEMIEAQGWHIIKKTYGARDNFIGEKEWWESDPPMEW